MLNSMLVLLIHVFVDILEFFCFYFFFFKQKTAYEMRISDWSSDVCSSDLLSAQQGGLVRRPLVGATRARRCRNRAPQRRDGNRQEIVRCARPHADDGSRQHPDPQDAGPRARRQARDVHERRARSEEHTSELQSLMRISYAVFCLKKKIHKIKHSILANNNIPRRNQNTQTQTPQKISINIKTCKTITKHNH